MRVLYDISTLGNIHCAEGVTGAGIFRATEQLAVALAQRDDVELAFSSAPWHRANSLRYLVETGRFDVGRFPLPTVGGEGGPSELFTALRSSHASGTQLVELLDRYLDDSYSAAQVYNSGRYDVYHVNWGGETTLPTDTRPAIVATVFDVIALKHPEWFVREGETNRSGQHLERLLRSVARDHTIIVNTESVRQDVLEMFSEIADDQVEVVPLGVSDVFERRPEADEIRSVCARVGVPDGHRYVLCVNTLEPRKNMVTAIEAYRRLVADRSIDGVSLVLAGSHGWLSEEVLARTEGGFPGGSVIATGYLPDADLAALYAGAAAFCYPSLDEGFGMPVLEAMHAGVPTVTSNRAPLVEVSGDAALHVDPLDPDDIADALRRVLSDDELRTSLRTRGLERAATYTWERSARMTTDVYRRITPDSTSSGRTSPGRRAFPRVARAGGRATVVTDWFGKSLGELRGRFAGERLFILGDTPAVDRAPLAGLGDEFTFAINDFPQRTTSRTWKPTFYTAAPGWIDDDRAEIVNALTGSLFFVDAASADRLRSGPDVVEFATDVTGRIDGVDLLDPTVPGVDDGPERALTSAIQIGWHLGFDPIILVEPMVAGAAGAESDEPSGLEQWHRACAAAIERHGGHVGVLMSGSDPTAYDRLDPYETVASPELPEFGRHDRAHLDETEVISTMIPDREGPPRVMLDVGAHRGTSARHFLPRNWQVYCFEPDPDNRSRLTKGYGSAPNIVIDPRAVGAEPKSGIPFYSSQESSGISGLSAFRDSHEVVDHVEVTTVAAIVDRYGIEHVDFLKIDVEGFDFDVLRGVPWDRVRPDVIECEYENAKTVPLGHTTEDIAEYLSDRGYAVYLSEWHPIVRYGVQHDWRRVVPWPGVDVPTESWGNILAFRVDPGYHEVERAFAALVARHDPSPTPRQSPGKDAAVTKTARPPAGQARKRRFYADRADRLRARAPGLYGLLKVARRAAVKLARRPAILLLMLAAIAAIVAAGALVSNDVARFVIWSGGVVAVLGAAIVAIGAHSLRTSQTSGARARAADRAIADVRRSVADLGRARSALDERARSLQAKLDDSNRRVVALEADLAALRASVAESTNAWSRRADGVEAGIADVAKATASLNDRVVNLDTQALKSNYANISGVRIHQRRLVNSEVEHIRTYWLTRLGLSMSDRELRYLAHKICLDEERCEGRLATTIQAATLRSLVLLAQPPADIQLLEIGTLFGISAGNLHRVGKRSGRRVELTLIDPLTGYYEQSIRDGQTGVPVTRDTLESNLAAMGVGESDYRIIQRRSTDPEAVEAASDRAYDLIVIDGDHSLAGVASDFDLYGPMVKPGGMLIFDDYDTDDWPAIKQFVDEEVRPLDGWRWIGGEWRTGILQRKLVTDESE